MPRNSQRPHSRYTAEALKLLGKAIELNRKSKQISTTELSERCGISRPTLRKIERGEPTVEIGAVFEAAAIVGVALFDSKDTKALQSQHAHLSNQAALLPESVRKPKGTSQEPDDAF